MVVGAGGAGLRLGGLEAGEADVGVELVEDVGAVAGGRGDLLGAGEEVLGAGLRGEVAFFVEGDVGGDEDRDGEGRAELLSALLVLCSCGGEVQGEG